MIYIEMNTLLFLSLYNSPCLVSKQNDEDEGCDTSIDIARKSHTTQADSNDDIDDNEADDFADDNDYKPENISDDYRNENVLNEESNDDDDDKEEEEEEDIGSDNENSKEKPLTGTVVA